MSGNIKLNTPSNGSVTISTPDTASAVTVTIPAATDTATLNTQAQTLTNKTLTAAGANSIEATSGPTSTQLAGNRNKIINGAMLVWQRGTSGFTTNNNYSADRWFLSSGGSLTTGAQASDAPTTYKYSLSVAASAYAQVNQRIESVNCNDLSGQTAIVSFWAKSLSGGTTLSAQLYYASASDNFGTITSIATVSNTITTSWAQYTATFTSLPSGVTNGIQLSIFLNSGSAAAFEITGVQLEKGATATPFENRLYGTELALCQRYLPAYAGPSATEMLMYGTQYPNTTNAYVFANFPVATRVAPTGITVSSASHFRFSGTNANMTISSMTYGGSSTMGGEISLVGTGGSSLQGGSLQSINASALVYFTGCEL